MSSSRLPILTLKQMDDSTIDVSASNLRDEDVQAPPNSPVATESAQVDAQMPEISIEQFLEESQAHSELTRNVTELLVIDFLDIGEPSIRDFAVRLFQAMNSHSLHRTVVLEIVREQLEQDLPEIERWLDIFVLDPRVAQEGIDTSSVDQTYNRSDSSVAMDDSTFDGSSSDNDRENRNIARPRIDLSKHLPIGAYDPFDKYTPMSQSQIDYGALAMRFILNNLQTSQDWNDVVDSICNQFSWDNDCFRTRRWFSMLELDQQMEVWIQREFGLRPGSRWILGPHDDCLSVWSLRWELNQCRIVPVDKDMPGMDICYKMARDDISRHVYRTPGVQEFSGGRDNLF